MSVSDHRTEPATIARLPQDKHNRRVPWFVNCENGEPDFRVIRRGGIDEAVRRQLCWVCGTDRGREAAFVIGPMCAINRISAEPPCHRECARYSADVCPFLSTPSMKRRERGLPEDRVDPAGKAIMRNPGVALVWYARPQVETTRGPFGRPTSKGGSGWKIVADPSGHPLFDVGEPSRVYWRCRGREATRAEVLESIESGLPILRQQAEEDGPHAVELLQRQHAAAMQLVPRA